MENATLSTEPKTKLEPQQQRTKPQTLGDLMKGVRPLYDQRVVDYQSGGPLAWDAEPNES